MYGKHLPQRIAATLIALACAAGFTAMPSQAATTWHVDTDAPPGGDGLTWDTAFQFLQDALTAAGAGDQIRAARGIYRPDEDAANPDGTRDRTATFQLITGVGLFGGYAGYGHSNPNDRDIAGHETILSGDLGENDGPGGWEHYDENSYHVVAGSGTDASAVLDGFTVTAGNADGDVPDNHGGGMYNGSGRPKVTNCTFSVNYAENGGGMCNNNSNATLTGCTFSDNYARSAGGGIYDYSSSPTLTKCVWGGNTADEDGGGMFNFLGSPMLVDCTFRGNRADADGGATFNYYSDPMLTNCTLGGNQATRGGGIHNEGYSSPIVAGCTFSGNSAISMGGGMYNSASYPELVNCTFSKNSAARGGGVGEDSACWLSVTNCIFRGNWDNTGMDQSAQIYHPG